MNSPDTNPMADLRHQLRALIAKTDPDSVAEFELHCILSQLSPNTVFDLADPSPACFAVLLTARDILRSAIHHSGTRRNERPRLRDALSSVENALDRVEPVESEEAESAEDQG